MKVKPTEEIERRRAQWRASYHKHKEKNKEKHRFYALRTRNKNVEGARARCREWYKLNPYSSLSEDRKNARREAYRKWYYKNHEKVKESYRRRLKARYLKNSRHFLEMNKAWAKKNPVVRQEIAQRRRARRLNASVVPDRITPWMKLIKSKPEAQCYFCGIKFSTNAIHFDHVVPLSKGGAHRLENICVSCPKCNLKKGTRTDSGWIERGQLVFPV